VAVAPGDNIEKLIRTIRGQKVILDADLARLYGVQTRSLNQAVKRNRKRFPDDFMFQLSDAEVELLRGSRSQIVILKRGKILNIGHTRSRKTARLWPPTFLTASKRFG
jgi:hypothetical protein